MNVIPSPQHQGLDARFEKFRNGEVFSETDRINLGIGTLAALTRHLSSFSELDIEENMPKKAKASTSFIDVDDYDKNLILSTN